MTSRESRLVFGLIVLGVYLHAAPLQAQWVTQSILLEPGWNSVFIEVEPEPRETAMVFQDMSIQSVWAWNKNFSSVQFTQDPNTLLPNQPEWLHWFPADSPADIVNNLNIIRGGMPYLIQVKGDQAINWQLTGTPILREIDWYPDSFNLVGFSLDPSSPPTFHSFFSLSPAHDGQPIRRLDSSGMWEPVANPFSTPMQAGEAFWIYCDGASNYAGPLQAETSSGLHELEFQRIVNTIPLRVRNNGTQPKTVTLSPLPSESPPSADVPALAGDVALEFNTGVLPGGTREWVKFPSELSLLLSPGQSLEVQIQVRRSHLVTYNGGAEFFLYQNLLEVSDGQSRFLFPVSSEGLGGDGSSTLLKSSPSLKKSGKIRKILKGRTEGATAPPDHAGLWIGTVAVDKVSIPANRSDPTTPVPTDSEYLFRILIHLDRDNQARLLQEAYLMFQPGTLIDDPLDGSATPSKIVDEPGRFVLITDESLLSNYSGSVLRDNETVGRRFSSTAFGFTEPIDMISSTSVFGATGSITTANVLLDYDDPLNPFKHVYHPDHDNLDRRFENKLPAGQESFTIVRSIEMRFTDEDPDGFATPGLGDQVLVGIYKESIRGVHKDLIHLEGTFRLNLVSLVDTLNGDFSSK